MFWLLNNMGVVTDAVDPDDVSGGYGVDTEGALIFVCVVFILLFFIEFFYILHLRYKYLDLKEKLKSKEDELNNKNETK